MSIIDSVNEMMKLIVENGCNYCGRYRDECENFNSKHCGKCDEFELAGDIESFARALISNGVHIYSHRTDEKESESKEKILEKIQEAIIIADWHRYNRAECIYEELNLENAIIPPRNVKVGDTIYFIELVPYFQKNVICSDKVIGFTDKGFLLETLNGSNDGVEHDLFLYERKFYLSREEAIKDLND